MTATNSSVSGMTADHWLGVWQDPQYARMKLGNVDAVLEYLDDAPKTILDIGAGPAFESREIHRRCGTEIWLLDGDFDTTSHRARSIRYGATDNMKFYSRLEDLRRIIEQDGIKNYHLVDANNINIPQHQTFDVIYSFLSCGFHYPVLTYAELIRNHSHAGTRLIFELRNGVDHGVEIVSKIKHYRKSRICEIRI